MKVSDAIKALTEDYKPDDHLAIAWWDFETFGYDDDIKKEDWPEICELWIPKWIGLAHIKPYSTSLTLKEERES